MEEIIKLEQDEHNLKNKTEEVLPFGVVGYI